MQCVQFMCQICVNYEHSESIKYKFGILLQWIFYKKNIKFNLKNLEICLTFFSKKLSKDVEKHFPGIAFYKDIDVYITP